MDQQDTAAADEAQAGAAGNDAADTSPRQTFIEAGLAKINDALADVPRHTPNFEDVMTAVAAGLGHVHDVMVAEGRTVLADAGPALEEMRQLASQFSAYASHQAALLAKQVEQHVAELKAAAAKTPPAPEQAGS